MTSTTLETKAAALEGLDFIETEEDVKAVEAATLKIQSTFRGKKIRSKVSGKQPEQATSEQQEATLSAAKQQQQRRGSTKGAKDNEIELSSKVAQMQVQDNNGNQMDQQQQQKSEAASSGGGGTAAPEEDEAQRAATKIQAGFKGYKTRKELEGKLPAAGGGGGGGQQEGAATAQ